MPEFLSPSSKLPVLKKGLRGVVGRMVGRLRRQLRRHGKRRGSEKGNRQAVETGGQHHGRLAPGMYSQDGFTGQDLAISLKMRTQAAASRRATMPLLASIRKDRPKATHDESIGRLGR